MNNNNKKPQLTGGSPSKSLSMDKILIFFLFFRYTFSSAMICTVRSSLNPFSAAIVFTLPYLVTWL
jgi:hypothetical protein